MVHVALTSHLTSRFADLAGDDLHVEAATVREVIAALEARAPGFAFYVCDELGRLRRHVNVFLGDERVSDRDGLSDPVSPGVRVFIAQALSGG